MKRIYMMQVMRKTNCEKQILHIKHFKKLENALGYVCSKTALKNCLPNEDFLTLGKTELHCFSVDEEGVPDDFEIRYENGIVVCIGAICPE